MVLLGTSLCVRNEPGEHGTEGCTSHDRPWRIGRPTNLLRAASGVPLGLPASKWMLEIGAVFMRTETELILKSRRVVPTRLLAQGFRFRRGATPCATSVSNGS